MEGLQQYLISSHDLCGVLGSRREPRDSRRGSRTDHLLWITHFVGATLSLSLWTGISTTGEKKPVVARDNACYDSRLCSITSSRCNWCNQKITPCNFAELLFEWGEIFQSVSYWCKIAAIPTAAILFVAIYLQGGKKCLADEFCIFSLMEKHQWGIFNFKVTFVCIVFYSSNSLKEPQVAI